MRNWFRRLWQSSRKQFTARPTSFRPTLEGLEERSLLDAGMGGFMMGMNGGMTPPAQVSPSSMMQSSMMMQPSSNAMMATQIDALFHMLDSRLLAVESALVARIPQLEGMIQSFNAMVTMQESAIAGHPINDLSGMM